MQFQVKGEEYFLTFVEDENRLYVFHPTPTGMDRFPVYEDAAKRDWVEALRKGSRRVQ